MRYMVYKDASVDPPWFFESRIADDPESLGDYGHVDTWEQAMAAANLLARNNGQFTP